MGGGFFDRYGGWIVAAIVAGLTLGVWAIIG